MLEIPRAFNPVFSPTGRYVGYGNQHAYVREVGTNQTWDFGGIDNGGPGAYIVGWFGDSMVAIARAIGGNLRSLELRDLFSTGGSVKVPFPSVYCPGLNGQRAVYPGRIFASVPAPWVGEVGGDRFFLDLLDGLGARDVSPAVTEHPDRGQAIFDGTHIAYPVPDAIPWRWIVRRLIGVDGKFDGKIVAEYAPSKWWMHLKLQTAPDGTHRLHAIGESGVVINGVAYDLPGETRGGSTWANGEELTWTCATSAGQPCVVGRPFARLRPDEPAIVVDGMLHVAIDLVSKPDVSAISIAATEQTNGLLRIEEVVPTAARRVFARQPDPIREIIVPELPPIFAGYLTSDPDAPGNTGGTKSGKPFLHEGFTQQGAPWWTPEEASRVLLVFVDLQESHAPEIELAGAKEHQTQFGSILSFYCDRARVTQDVLDEARKSKDVEGRPTVLGLRAYPTGPNDTAAALRERLLADVALYGDEFTFAMYAPSYDQSGFWPVALVTECIEVAAEVVAIHPEKFIDVSFFGWKRPPIREAIVNAATRVLAAVPTPDRSALLRSVKLRKPTPVEPTPEPVPVPTPTTSPIGRATSDRSSGGKVAKGSAIAAAGLSAFLAFFFGRKKKDEPK